MQLLCQRLAVLFRMKATISCKQVPASFSLQSVSDLTSRHKCLPVAAQTSSVRCQRSDSWPQLLLHKNDVPTLLPMQHSKYGSIYVLCRLQQWFDIFHVVYYQADFDLQANLNLQWQHTPKPYCLQKPLASHRQTKRCCITVGARQKQSWVKTLRLVI